MRLYRSRLRVPAVQVTKEMLDIADARPFKITDRAWAYAKVGDWMVRTPAGLRLVSPLIFPTEYEEARDAVE